MPFLQRVKAAADDHQKIVEVVRDAAGQLTERIELLRFCKLLLHLLELELRLAALGNVAGDLGETDEFAVLADRVDDDAGPEERAVLADAPAFFLIAALFFRGCAGRDGACRWRGRLRYRSGRNAGRGFPRVNTP